MGLSIFSLAGKTAIVTGASRGIGKACALALADAGADITITSRKLPDLTGTVREIEAKGCKALHVATDVLKEADVERMVKNTVDHFGKVDILVNNAGVAQLGPVEKLTAEEWDRVIDTNLKGTFLCCKAAIPHMKKQQYGRIINMASLGGIRGFKNMACYNASKGGILRFSESLALELINDGITVNCICPGYIATSMNEAFFKTEKGKMELSKYPMKRAGRVQELAGAIIYLASEASSYVTATSIIVDGAQRWKGAI